MIKRLLLAVSIMLLATTSISYCELDRYGNEIESLEGYGTEDAAGTEVEVDLMEAPVYSEEEQAEVSQYIPETVKVHEKGIVSIKCDLPDSWPGYNISIVLYDEDNRRVEITCYSQNAHEAKENLPVGVYKVYRAFVPGDESGSLYPMVCSESRIEVMDTKIAEITVMPAVQLKEEVDHVSEMESVSQENQEANSDISYTEPVTDMLEFGVLFLVVFGVAAGIVFVILKIKEKNRYS